MQIECKWIEDKDNYGTSWHCDTCGKCVFYEKDEPDECIKDSNAVVIPGFKNGNS